MSEDKKKAEENPFATFKTEGFKDGAPVQTPAKAGKPEETPKAGAEAKPAKDDPLAAFKDEDETDDGVAEADADEFDGEADDGDGDAGDGEDDSSSSPDDSGEGEDDSGDEEDGEEEPRKKNSAKRRIDELTRARREAERRAEALERRLEALEREKSGDKPDAKKDDAKPGDKSQVADDEPDIPVKDEKGNTLPEPDPKKYKYGEVDTAYLKDVMKYQSAYARALAQHEAQTTRQAEAAQRQAEELRTAWEGTVEKGMSDYDDFEEKVLVTADRGDWPLTKETFEIASTSEHGAAILYHLAHNRKQAVKLAKMSERDQARYLGRLEAALETSQREDKVPKKKRTPGAAPPPARQNPRGHGGKFINPAQSENFADFEAAVARAEDKKR